jgi:hypothetical protein
MPYLEESQALEEPDLTVDKRKGLYCTPRA